MKVKIISLTQKEVERRDYRDIYAIEINDKRKFEVWDGEPEDNNLSRNFNLVYNIPDLLKLAFEAGKNGEELIFENEEVDDY